MRKLISSVLALLCMFCLAGCSNDERTVWDWAQSLKPEDITAVIPRSDVDSDTYQEFEPLNEGETLELVMLLNELTKDNFTENKHLSGITPTFHLEIQMDSETYYINEANAPDGALEMKYQEKQWWINSAELMKLIQKVTSDQSME